MYYYAVFGIRDVVDILTLLPLAFGTAIAKIQPILLLLKFASGSLPCAFVHSWFSPPFCFKITHKKHEYKEVRPSNSPDCTTHFPIFP